MGDELFIALSGARAATRQMEATANNAANSATTGFKASRVAFELVDGELAGTGSVVAEQSDGVLVDDGNPLHIGLQGPAWMTVQVGDEQLLTRDGTFHLEGGTVVTQAGHAVLTDSGPLTLEPGDELQITAKGGVLVNDEERGNLLLKSASAVEPIGGNLYRGMDLTDPDMGRVSVKQGALEQSNADPVRTMTSLIEASRYFEAMQKLLRASDEMSQRGNQSAGGSR